MSRLNLLPWRQQLRRQRYKQQQVIMLIAIGLLLMIAMVSNIWLFEMNSHHQIRNQWLDQAIHDAEMQIQQQKILMQGNKLLADKIHELQIVKNQHAEVFLVLSELAKVVSRDIVVRKCIRIAAMVSIEGNAKSNQALTAFLQTLEDSQLFYEARLGVIKQSAANKDSGDFSMTLKIEPVFGRA